MKYNEIHWNAVSSIQYDSSSMTRSAIQYGVRATRLNASKQKTLSIAIPEHCHRRKNNKTSTKPFFSPGFIVSQILFAYIIKQTQAAHIQTRQADRLTDWQTDRQTLSLSLSLPLTHSLTHRQTRTHARTCTYTHSCENTHTTEKYVQKYTDTHTHTNTHRGRHTDTQTHTHTHKHTHTDTYTHTNTTHAIPPPPVSMWTTWTSRRIAKMSPHKSRSWSQ